MGDAIRLHSAAAFQSAFRAAPEVAEEIGLSQRLGLYGWKTPPMDGFQLPETDELIVALHLGGSRRVRAVTDHGLSRSCSAPGLLTILPPGRSAAFRTDGSVSLVSLHIPKHAAGLLQTGQLARPAQPWVPRFAFRDSFVSAGMESLLRAARSAQSVRRDYYTKVADALLCHLAQWRVLPAARDCSGPGASSCSLGLAPLDELLAYIDSQLGAKLGLDELASRSGLSRAAFTSSFRSTMGLSPHQYLDQRRIAAAKKMLCETDFDLAYIAQETGYSSQSHFTANFRNLSGCTPARFRASR